MGGRPAVKTLERPPGLIARSEREAARRFSRTPRLADPTARSDSWLAFTSDQKEQPIRARLAISAAITFPHLPRMTPLDRASGAIRNSNLVRSMSLQNSSLLLMMKA